MNKFILILIILTGCSYDGTITPVDKKYVRLTRTNYENPVDVCNNLGATITLSGLDLNKNLLLEDSEVDLIDTVCLLPVPDQDEEYNENDFTCQKHNNGCTCKKHKKD